MNEKPKTAVEAINMDLMSGSPCFSTKSGKCIPRPLAHSDQFRKDHNLTSEDFKQMIELETQEKDKFSPVVHLGVLAQT